MAQWLELLVYTQAVVGSNPAPPTISEKTVKTILYFQYPWRLWRARLAGIYRYAAKAGWRVQMVEHGLTAASVAGAMRFWEPDGCIVERTVMELPWFRAREFGNVPVVFCDPNRTLLRKPFLGVEHDSAETAALAARELVSLGLRHFAFVGNIIPREWAERRRNVLAAEAAAAGGTFDAFDPGGTDCIASFFARIRPWLRGLPRPCGILAANDISGDLVLQACRMERLRVPDDIAVVGIDNDEFVCEHAVPPLTSVAPDFEESGYLAAQLLGEAMAGRVRAPVSRTFGSKEVFRRRSTRVFRRRDDAVRHALETIARRACEGLTAAEVCREIGGSRRQAETRFRAIAGRSVGEEIAAARIARAKALLLRRNVAIEALHGLCGYGNASSLRRAFKKATGLSLRAWRLRKAHSAANAAPAD